MQASDFDSALFTAGSNESRGKYLNLLILLFVCVDPLPSSLLPLIDFIGRQGSRSFPECQYEGGIK